MSKSITLYFLVHSFERKLTPQQKYIKDVISEDIPDDEEELQEMIEEYIADVQAIHEQQFSTAIPITKEEYYALTKEKKPIDSDYLETHFEVVRRLTMEEHIVGKSNLVFNTLEEKGIGGLYELAEDLTNEFQLKNQDRVWDGEFFEEIDKFLDEKLSNK